MQVVGRQVNEHNKSDCSEALFSKPTDQLGISLSQRVPINVELSARTEMRTWFVIHAGIRGERLFKKKTKKELSKLVPSIFLKHAGVEWVYQVNDMIGGIGGCVVFKIWSSLKMGARKARTACFVELLGFMPTLIPKCLGHLICAPISPPSP